MITENVISEAKKEAIRYIYELPEGKILSILDYLKYMYDKQEQEGFPLDDFDYELSRRADEAIARGDMEFVSFDEVLKKAGLTYEDIQNPV